MKKILGISLLLHIVFLLFTGCSSNNNPAGNNGETTKPAIINITAEKTKILYGGQDPAIITCNASGGNLKYVWQVDLGDILPVNSDHSKVSFSGAACCVGEKTINCTVSNDKGSDTKAIIITILETETKPEIISIETNKTEITYGPENSANIVCYAIGGGLKYVWEADCGSLSFKSTDSSKVSYTASSDCVGLKNIKCTVSNRAGNDTKTIQITVLKK